MKKYKLKDLVANGSHARRKVDADVLIGDVSAGYGHGDILDANATVQLIKVVQENQAVIDAAQSEEIKDLILLEVLSKIEDLQNNVQASVTPDGNLILGVNPF